MTLEEAREIYNISENDTLSAEGIKQCIESLRYDIDTSAELLHKEGFFQRELEALHVLLQYAEQQEQEV